MKERQPTESRQRQIAEAALQIIARHGLGKFTTAAIAQEVGLAEGTIFRHFANKEAIVFAAIGLMQERLAGHGVSADEAPLQRLGIFMRNRLELVLSHPGVFRAFFSDELTHAAGAEGAQMVAKLKKESTDFVRACLCEAIAAGQLRKGVEAEFLIRMIQGTLHAFVFAPLPKDWAGQSKAEIAARIWQTILATLRR